MKRFVVKLMSLSGLLFFVQLVSWAEKGSFAAQPSVQQRTSTQGAPVKSTPDYVLEVVGLGVTFEKYRQGALWREIAASDGFTSLREPDPKKYPWGDLEKMGISSGRGCHALYNGANYLPMYWGIPSFFASLPSADPADKPSATEPIIGLAGCGETNGMGWHLFVSGGWNLADRPDRLIEEVFDFFDSHPDIPVVVVSAIDNMDLRNLLRVPGSPPLVRDGYYVPERPDATVVFALARRERVDPIRAFTWDDPDNNFGQERVRRMYVVVK